jgi:hypothetical protein
MHLNDLLQTQGLDPEHVLVFRHRPSEPGLHRVLPWLAAEKPEVFNAYQQTQGNTLERVMQSLNGSGYVASFIGHEPRKALFVGIYAIGESRPLTYEQFWQMPAHLEMKAFGMNGWKHDSERTSVLWFDLALSDAYATWKGKLVVDWPPPERSWWRRAHKNAIPILAIHEESAFDAAMPAWDQITLTWQEVGALPVRWRAALSQWRGIYYIFDESDGKGYVGSAYGSDNLLGRWRNYADAGHGGNRLLRPRDPRNFRFAILQRVSPDMDPTEVIRLEGSWKQRLHTRAPHGLNDN